MSTSQVHRPRPKVTIKGMMIFTYLFAVLNWSILPDRATLSASGFRGLTGSQQGGIVFLNGMLIAYGLLIVFLNWRLRVLAFQKGAAEPPPFTSRSPVVQSLWLLFIVSISLFLIGIKLSEGPSGHGDAATHALFILCGVLSMMVCGVGLKHAIDEHRKGRP